MRRTPARRRCRAGSRVGDLARLRVLDHRPDIHGPSVGIVRRTKRPTGGGLPTAGAQAEAIVVPMDLVKPGRTRSDLDQWFSVHMEKDAFRGDNDGGPLLVPTGVALASGHRPAKCEIIARRTIPSFSKRALRSGESLPVFWQPLASSVRPRAAMSPRTKLQDLPGQRIALTTSRCLRRSRIECPAPAAGRPKN